MWYNFINVSGVHSHWAGTIHSLDPHFMVTVQWQLKNEWKATYGQYRELRLHWEVDSGLFRNWFSRSPGKQSLITKLHESWTYFREEILKVQEQAIP